MHCVNTSIHKLQKTVSVLEECNDGIYKINSHLKGIYRTYLPATLLTLIRKCLPYCSSTGWRVTAVQKSTALVFRLHMQNGATLQLRQANKGMLRQHNAFVVIILSLLFPVTMTTIKHISFPFSTSIVCK